MIISIKEQEEKKTAGHKNMSLNEYHKAKGLENEKAIKCKESKERFK